MKPVVLRSAKRLYRAIRPRWLRAACFNTYLAVSRRRRTVAQVEGLTFDLDLSQLIDVSVYLEEYEREIVAAVQRWCRAGWTALDIGANMGAHTLRLASLVGPSGRVFAFEPTNYAYRKLVRNISLNSFSNIQAFQIALSDSNASDRHASVRASWRSDGVRTVESHPMTFCRLDDWCAGQAVDLVHLIKLDVDGHEFPILKGASQLLRRCQPVLLIEAGGWHFADESTNPFRLLTGLGYRFWDAKTFSEYSSFDAIGQRLPERDPELSTSFNVIAAPGSPG